MKTDREKSRPRAVALRYDEQRDAAPRVIAKGTGIVAERIVEAARANGIHVHEDPGLVAALSKLDLEAPIPESLYRAVAEVLAFIYRLDRRMVPSGKK